MLRTVAVVTTLITVFAASKAEDGTCTKEEFGNDVQNWMNHIIRIWQTSITRIKVEKINYLKSLHHNFSIAFKESGCPDLWEPVYPEEDRQKPGWEFLKEFKNRDGLGVPKAVVELAKEFEEFTFLYGRDHIFASCVGTEVRKIVFRWLEDEDNCKKDAFSVNEDGIKKFPVASYSTDPEHEQDMRSYFAIWSKALITTLSCGSKENYARASALLNQYHQQDYCYAAVDSFESDPCYDKFESNCPVVMECINQFFGNFDKYAMSAFSGSEVSLIKKCLTQSKLYWDGKDKPARVPHHALILARGIRLYRNTVNMRKLFTESFDTKVKPFFQALVSAYFRADSCACGEYRDE